MAAVLGWLRTGCRFDGVDVMGMAPSCHCICPGTGGGGSPSPSGGGGPQTTTCNATTCSGSISPVQYQLVVSKSGGTDTPACFADYLGTWQLYIYTLTPGVCIWRTVETPMNIATCVATTTECTVRRWEIVLDSYTTFNIRAISYIYNGSSCPSYRSLRGTQDVAATVRNCLSGATVTNVTSGTTWTGLITAV